VDSGSPSQEIWSIAKVLKWATADFRERGIESSRLDAELLLSKALGLDRVGLIRDASRPLEQGELARFRQLIQRRRRHEPIAYILGEREFYGLMFKVDPRTLIPRPDTECLVETSLARTAAQNLYGRALDLCTGSGCVAIAFLKQRPTWRVTAIDISEGALAVARENSLRHGVAGALELRAGDLLVGLSNSARYELVMANPPYIPAHELPALSRDILDFEPKLALDGGNDGLAVVRRLLEQVAPFLVEGGICAIEVHHDQARRAVELFAQAGFEDVQASRDYGGHERVVSGSYRPVMTTG
jgi:release factor glutamine methyltransferase